MQVERAHSSGQGMHTRECSDGKESRHAPGTWERGAGHRDLGTMAEDFRGRRLRSVWAGLVTVHGGQYHWPTRAVVPNNPFREDVKFNNIWHQWNSIWASWTVADSSSPTVHFQSPYSDVAHSKYKT